MRGFVAGICVGVVLTAVTAGLAQEEEAVNAYWLSGRDVANAQEAVRSAYAAGAYDGMAYIVTVFHTLSQKNPADATLASLDKTFTAQKQCLDEKGDTLGDFSDWADTEWAGHSDNAAAVALSACK